MGSQADGAVPGSGSQQEGGEGVALSREGLSIIMQDMMSVLYKKEIAPADALHVANMLEREVREKVEEGKKYFLENGRFTSHASSPDSFRQNCINDSHNSRNR